MKNKKIAVIGSGKLAKAIVDGYLYSGYPADEITIIKSRPSLNEDVWFKEKNILVSDDYARVRDATYILLAVKPEGSAEVLRKLKNAVSACNKDVLIISLISGLSITVISTAACFHLGNIIRATANTNIRHCKGIVCVAGIDRGMYGAKDAIAAATLVLQRLGAVVRENTAKLTKSITTVGSMNAIDAKVLQITYVAALENDISLPVYSFKEWLEKIHFALSRKSDCDMHIAGLAQIIKYLQAKEIALIKALGYTDVDAQNRALCTLVSTIESLLATPQALTLATIDTVIASVATKDGCTEKGISKITSAALCADCEQLLIEVFTAIHRRAKKFKTDVKKSFQQ